MSRRHFWGVDSHLMFLNFSSLEPFIITWHSPAEWWMRACGDYSGYWIAASWYVAKIWNFGHVDFAMLRVWWGKLYSWDGRQFVFKGLHLSLKLMEVYMFHRTSFPQGTHQGENSSSVQSASVWSTRKMWVLFCSLFPKYFITLPQKYPHL